MTPIRGRSPFRASHEDSERHDSPDQLYLATRLDARSRSPSPNPTPSQSEYYGTTQLEQRSRSPSPVGRRNHQHHRRPGGRRLPPTPNKPSTLSLTVQAPETSLNFPVVSRSPTIPQTTKSPGSINFPKLNASPTHVPKLQMPPHPPGWRERNSPNSSPQRSATTGQPRSSNLMLAPADSPGKASGGGIICQQTVNSRPRMREQFQYSANKLPPRQEEPLSFEAAVAIGRGSRQLPSPMPNGYKPGQRERDRLRENDRDRDQRSRFGRPMGSTPPGPGSREWRSESDEDDWC